MSLPRRNLLLAAILTLLVGLDLALAPDQDGATRARRVFPELDVSQVARIRISADEASVELRREHGRWVLPARAGFPALEFPVRELLTALGGLMTVDRVSTESTLHSELGVTRDAPRIRIEDRFGDPVAELRQATTILEGGGSYVRPVAGDTVYRAPTLAPVQLEARGWLDLTLSSCDTARVSALRLRSSDPAAEIELQRREDGRFETGTGRLISPALLQPLLQSVCRLVLTDLAPEGAALGEPWLELELELSGTEAQRHLFVIGESFDSERRKVRDSAWDPAWIGLLPEFACVRLHALLGELGR